MFGFWMVQRCLVGEWFDFRMVGTFLDAILYSYGMVLFTSGWCHYIAVAIKENRSLLHGGHLTHQNLLYTSSEEFSGVKEWEREILIELCIGGYSCLVRYSNVQYISLLCTCQQIWKLEIDQRRGGGKLWYTYIRHRAQVYETEWSGGGQKRPNFGDVICNWALTGTLFLILLLYLAGTSCTKLFFNLT